MTKRARLRLTQRHSWKANPNICRKAAAPFAAAALGPCLGPYAFVDLHDGTIIRRPTKPRAHAERAEAGPGSTSSKG